MRAHLAFAFLAALALPAAVLGVERRALVSQAPLPWRSIDEDDIRVITDARIETAARLELIGRATRTIDIVSYAMSTDQAVAMPLLSALRDAAGRGVRVRFLTNQFFTTVLDSGHGVLHYLCDAATPAPIQLLLAGSSDPTDSWGLSSFAHEKLLIVDGRWVLHGGRMFNSDALRWLDKAYLIKGALASDSGAVFERLWKFSRRFFQTFSSPVLPPGRRPAPFRRYSTPPEVALDEARSRALGAELVWLTEPSRPGEARARLIHYDFLQQLWLRDFPGGTARRLALLDDPIARALVERINEPGTHEILIGTMIALFRPELKQALFKALKNGTKVHLFVNEAAPTTVETPLALNWVISVPQLRELLAAGADIETFDTSSEDGYDWTFLHEKLAVIDDTVFFGSHNFSEPSSTNNDEATYEVRAPRFAAMLRRLFYVDMRISGSPLDLAEREDPFFGFKLWLGRQIEWLF